MFGWAEFSSSRDGMLGVLCMTMNFATEPFGDVLSSSLEHQVWNIKSGTSSLEHRVGIN